MLHEILYTLHIIGMAAIISIASYLLINKESAVPLRKKLSLYLMSAAHTQLLTGFALFFLMLADVNHMKIGIKMLLAIAVAVLATLYRKKIAADEQPNGMFLIILLASSITITIVAFAL
jgi:hypothetical protein